MHAARNAHTHTHTHKSISMQFPYSIIYLISSSSVIIVIWFNSSAVYLRGAGGFSKSSQPYSYTKYPSSQTLAYKIPKSQPFAVFEESTHPSQVNGIYLWDQMYLLVISSEAGSSGECRHNYMDRWIKFEHCCCHFLFIFWW